MKRSIEEHAARFDGKADDYADSKSEEYHACVSLVVEHAAPEPGDSVLDLGTGTGVVALALADDARRVVGRDISEGMLAKARETAADRGVGNVTFGEGRFREPAAGDADVDVVTSNFALHHLDDDGKREAVEVVAGLEPRRFVLGDVMLFEDGDPDEPFYSPEHDDPATVGTLAEAFTDAGFAVTAVERVHDQVGVILGSALCERSERDRPGGQSRIDRPVAGPRRGHSAPGPSA